MNEEIKEKGTGWMGEWVLNRRMTEWMCLIYWVKKVVFGIPIYRFLLPASFLLPISGYPS